MNRYGCALRIYDNGGRSFDRYTLIPPRWALAYRERPGLWDAMGASEHPFHPQGFGQSCSAAPGPHLGQRIHWNTLPPDVQRLARQTYPEFTP